MLIWKEGDEMNLYPHQIAGLKQAANFNKVAFYWDMGL